MAKTENLIEYDDLFFKIKSAIEHGAKNRHEMAQSFLDSVREDLLEIYTSLHSIDRESELSASRWDDEITFRDWIWTMSAWNAGLVSNEHSYSYASMEPSANAREKLIEIAAMALNAARAYDREHPEEISERLKASLLRPRLVLDIDKLIELIKQHDAADAAATKEPKQ